MGTAQVVLFAIALVLASTLALSLMNSDAIRRETLVEEETLRDLSSITRTLSERFRSDSTFSGSRVPERTTFATVFATFFVASTDSVAEVEFETSTLGGTAVVRPSGVSVHYTKGGPE